jgi:hypothetical protein
MSVRAFTALALLFASTALAGFRPVDRSARCRPDRSDRLCLSDPSLFRFLPTPPDLSQQCSGNVLSGTKGEAITFTRASSAACQKSDGTMVTVGSGAPRLQANGLLVEPQSTNVTLQNDALDSVSWSKNTSTVTANVRNYGFGATMDRVNNTGGGGDSVSQGITVASTTGPFVLSGYLADPSSTGSHGLWLRCSGTTAATCTCGTSDGSACTTNAGGGSDCAGVFTAGTTPIRAWVVATCTAAITNPTVILLPNGAYPVNSPSNADYGGIQLEVGTVLGQPTSVIPTLGTPVTRVAEGATFVKPAGLSESAGCAKTCVAPKWSGTVTGSATRLFLVPRADLTARFQYAPASGVTLSATNSVTIAGVDATFTQDVSKCYRTKWDSTANSFGVTNLSTGVSASAAFSGYPTFDADVRIGQNSVAEISNVSVGGNPEACP